jgi:hypothetical protein
MAATLWFYVRDDKRQGPVDFEHLVTMLLAGQVPHNALVWHQGLREWSPADVIPEIAEQLPPPLPEPPPLPSAAKPAAAPSRPAPDPVPAATPAPMAAPASPASPATGAAAGSPRVEELRKRLEKDPGSRLFAQLAEELRKDGQLEDAIDVCHAGLAKHPNYPSARITLGRALLDSGDPAAARVELESVVQGAPDNILARKLLDECLATLGPQAGIPAPVRPPAVAPPAVAPAAVAPPAVAHPPTPPATTPASPPPDAAAGAAQPSGNWWRSLLGSAAAASTSAAPPPSAAPSVPPPPAPVSANPVVSAAAVSPVLPDEPEDEEPPPAPRAPDEDLPPIPLVAADDEPFELVAPYEGPVAKRPAATGDTGPIAVVPSPPPAPPAPAVTAPPPVVPPAAAPPKIAAPAPAIPPARPPSAVPPPVTPPSAAPPPVTAPSAAPPPLPSAARTPKKPAASDLTGLLDEDAAAAPRIFVPSLMPPTGSLADTDFPDLIHGLHDRRWTGIIELNRGRVDSAVTVQEGRLTFATSTNRDERLGELLLRKERITLRQYYEAGKAIRKGKRLGALLVEQGALDARDLVKAVVDHTQEVIYSVFLWTEGFYRLREGSDASAETITLKLSTANIILEGIHRITAWSRIERGVGGPDARYVRSPDYKERLPEMTLSPEKLLLLAGHEGERDVDTLCRESDLSDYEVCRTIWAFRVIGVLKQVPPPP